MANKSTKGNLTKTVVMKANLDKEDFELWKSAIKEYQGYKDMLSKWVAQNLTTMKIGDLLPYIDKPTNVYCQLCEQHKDEPLYKLFNYDANSRKNAMYEIIRKTNCDGYNGNILGISETYYRSDGFIKSVLANYATKITTLKPIERKRKVDVDSSEDLVRSQVVYEMQKHNINNVKDFEQYINDYLKVKDFETTQYIERMEMLYEYFKNHEEEIKEHITLTVTGHLKDFAGVKVNMDKCSMTLGIRKNYFSIERVDGTCTYILHLYCNKKTYDIKLWGNRQVVVNKDGNPVEILDLINNHGDSINVTIKNNEIYFAFTVTSDFQKPEHKIVKPISVDVNTKHILMSTDIVDNGKIKGYFNIYKALVEDKRFMSLVSENKEDRDFFVGASKYVWFCPIETEYLFTRYAEQKDLWYSPKARQLEKVFSDILDELYDKYKDNDVHTANYISNVRKFRSQCKSYFTLKMKYRELQRQFDIKQGYNDIFTQSKETIDKQRWENPFIKTNEAIELLQKMENVSRTLLGCRDNIITYAYNVFEQNNYDTIVLENLESSQFENYDSIISPKSLLNYHRLKGKTMEYLLSDECKVKVVDNEGKIKDVYNFVFDVDGCISDITLTTKGETKKQESLFRNTMIKVVHFADIKDKFIQLGNNGKLQTALVPSYYTSQMDSKNHCIYLVEKENTKTHKKEVKLANKRCVRKQQEWHINGLLADYNAPCNMTYIIKTPEMREIMCSKPKTKNGYSMPILTSSVKRQDKMITELKKIGNFALLND